MDQFEKIENMIDFWQFKEAKAEIKNLKLKVEEKPSNILFLEKYYKIVKDGFYESKDFEPFDLNIKYNDDISQNLNQILIIVTSFGNINDAENYRLKINEFNKFFKKFIPEISFDINNKFLMSRISKIYVLLGHFIHHISQNFKDAIFYFKEAIAISKNINHSIYVKAHSELGDIYMVRGELNSAIDIFKIVSENYDILSPYDKLRFLTRKGILISYRGNFGEAISII